jgi:RND superfamily putative drug exporter
MTAMAGMFLAGNAVFTSFGIGTVLVVAVAVLGSVTVLPAVISKLGDNVEKGRAPLIARRRASGKSRAWAFVIDHVL